MYEVIRKQLVFSIPVGETSKLLTLADTISRNIVRY